MIHGDIHPFVSYILFVPIIWDGRNMIVESVMSRHDITT